MFSADKLMKEARDEWRLHDFGAMDFVEGLQVLVKSINEEAHLTPPHIEPVRQHLVRALANRLRMQRDLKRHLEIKDEEVLPPIFITSLPRTGSTKLQRLLAASGCFNAMNYWQTYNFAPFEDIAVAKLEADPRIAVAAKFLDWIRVRAPGFIGGHPMYVDEIEEELYLLDSGFNSLYNHAAFLHVPSYIGWVLGKDPRRGFEDMRNILQYMQWQFFPGMQRRWVLKTPALLGTESAFADVFKGTNFIVTHRHPEEILASVAALHCGCLSMYSDADFSVTAGELMMGSFGETVRMHLAWRDSYPQDKVMDVRFDDIVNHEFDALPKIFEFLNVSFTTDARNGIEAWLKMDALRHKPARQFQLAEFGLTSERVNERFAPYLQRYAEFI